MVLVYKISKFVHIVDIRTMQTFEIDEKIYYKHTFTATLSRDRLSEFVVINIENVDNDFNSSRAAIRQRYRQVQVEIARKEDFGVNDRTFIVNTHLGEILNFNDTVLGYDLLQNQTSDIDDFSKIDQYLPDIILVKKTYPKFRKRQKSRFWKLRHLNKEKNDEKGDKVENPFSSDEEEEVEEKKKNTKSKPKRGLKKKNKKEAKQDHKNDKDYEYFLQDLEDDPELRANVNLYKDDDVIAQLEAQIGNLKLDDEPTGREIKKAVRKTEAGKQMAEETAAERAKNKAILKASLAKRNEDGEGSGWESVEEDAPAIQLTELLGNMKIEGDSDEEEKEE